MILISHAQGNAFVRALLTGAISNGLPTEFHTTLGFGDEERWLNLLPTKLGSSLKRRSFPIPSSAIRRYPVKEIIRLLPSWPGIKHLQRHEKGWASLDSVQQSLDRRVAQNIATHADLDAVYTYEDGAKHTLQTARSRGVKGFYDLPIGYWRSARRIFEEEAELQPQWANTLGGLHDSPEKLARKDEELALSDKVIVASSFTQKTLQEYPSKLRASISVVPYGAPVPVPESELKDRLHQRRDSPLRVLFVGGLSQRKGLSYLFHSVQSLGQLASLTVVGRKPAASCPPLDRALSACKYFPSLPPSELFTLMGRHDVLVLPSLFEGFGLVLLEAMAQGLPIIASPHTAAPDFIESGREGFITPIRDSEAMTAAMHTLATDLEKRNTMALNARNLAARKQWDAYGSKLASLLKPV